MLSAAFMPLPVHPGRPTIEHLHPIGADVALTGFRVPGEHEWKRDVRTAIVGPARQNRQVVQRAVALHNLVTRGVLDRLRHQVAEAADHRQHLKGVHDALGHLRRHQLVDLAREVIERFHTERQTDSLHRAVHVRSNRDIEAGRLLEEQRRTTARRLAGAIDHGRDLEIGADRIGDAREQLAALEIG